MELSRLSLQHKVPEQAGSPMDVGCQPSAESRAPSWSMEKAMHSLGRKPGAPALTSGPPGVFLGIPMASNSKTALGFQD